MLIMQLHEYQSALGHRVGKHVDFARMIAVPPIVETRRDALVLFARFTLLGMPARLFMNLWIDCWHSCACVSVLY